MKRLGPGRGSTGGVGDGGQGETFEMLTHVVAGLLPNGEQDALTLVVARPVLMGFTEVAEGDGSIDGGDDLVQVYVAGRASQCVAPADAALGLHESRALQGQQDLLEVRLGETRSFRDVAHRGGAGRIGVEGQRQEGPTGIVPSGRNAHDCIVEGDRRFVVHSVASEVPHG